jgi:hypothetical protein
MKHGTYYALLSSWIGADLHSRLLAMASRPLSGGVARARILRCAAAAMAAERRRARPDPVAHLRRSILDRQELSIEMHELKARALRRN